MSVLFNILVAILFTALILYIAYITICAVWFVLQEINHSFKNAKRAIKKTLWDVEWKLKH
jgi:hypothetical protein